MTRIREEEDHQSFFISFSPSYNLLYSANPLLSITYFRYQRNSVYKLRTFYSFFQQKQHRRKVRNKQLVKAVMHNIPRPYSLGVTTQQ